ncbi:hypothetical protein DFP72DRAFT_581320 [Ephemerocybe angulata]|uniref:Uncharacterized protein n=1 Tax=Ephemerocybe angulata TaxID=980116 RepID=A0A8H6LYZ5_9AGAR|nr:hypothetical protein DFP72DRAFT_581320 [Tulosesus angulatus]
MVFLVPSQFETFAPAPAPPGQRPLGGAPTRPWNGDLVATGLRPSNRTLSERIPVSAIETDGESRLESWPNEFVLQILYTDRDLRREMSQWVSANAQPTCNFVPARLRASGQRDTILANFRNLSRVLNENHTVAIAPWRTGELPYQGSGIIIYPSENSGAYLIGAVFHSGRFPDFVTNALSPTVVIPPALPMSSGQYQPPTHSSPYSSHVPQSQYRHSQQSSSPHQSSPNSPVDHPGSSYRSIQPMPSSRNPNPYTYQPTGNYGSTYPPSNP